MKRAIEPTPSNEELLPSETICSRCGMSKEEWSANQGRGVQFKGEVYCCQGCADDEGCTCDTDRIEADAEEPEPSPKRRSSQEL